MNNKPFSKGRTRPPKERDRRNRLFLFTKRV
nr:MAG TPA: hypothetical protein [Caudoviricetes sp.]